MKKLVKAALLVSVLAVYFAVGTPHAVSLYSSYKYYSELGQSAAELKSNNAAVDAALSAYQEKYQDVNISSNFDIAKTVAGLAGIEFISVSSLVNKDGDMFVCSEVTSIDDVNFFNDTTEYMSFELNLSNSHDFITALNSSALTVYRLVVNEKEMKVTLIVNTVCQKGEVPA